MARMRSMSEYRLAGLPTCRLTKEVRREEVDNFISLSITRRSRRQDVMTARLLPPNACHLAPPHSDVLIT